MLSEDVWNTRKYLKEKINCWSFIYTVHKGDKYNVPLIIRKAEGWEGVWVVETFLVTTKLEQ